MHDNAIASIHMQPAFVGLEAASLVVLDSDYENGKWWWKKSLPDFELLCLSGRGLLAVGSEDCTVCLLRLHPASDALEVSHTLQGHASSVKALSVSRSARHLLFSGGARASLKVWSIGEGVSKPS